MSSRSNNSLQVPSSQATTGGFDEDVLINGIHNKISSEELSGYDLLDVLLNIASEWGGRLNDSEIFKGWNKQVAAIKSSWKEEDQSHRNDEYWINKVNTLYYRMSTMYYSGDTSSKVCPETERVPSFRQYVMLFSQKMKAQSTK